MLILVLTFIAFISIVLSKHIFGKWFNHLAIYTFVWYMVITLYELKLMSYVEVKPTAWIVMGAAFISFFLGTITVFLARRAGNKETKNFTSSDEPMVIFSDGGKVIRYALIVCSVIGLFAVAFQWMALIKKFGSVAAVIIQANIIYTLRVEGKMTDALPYVYIIAYIGVFFSGIYTAYKNKLTLLALLPIIAIILKEISNASRAGMMMAFFMFIASFFLYRHLYPTKIKGKSSKVRLIIATLSIMGLVLAGAGIVRSTRGSIENFSASSRQLKKLKGGFLITPSLYLYFSSHIGVLSEYLDRDYDYSSMFGETTFQPIYNFVSKTGIVRHPDFYEKGYFIPMWTNTATYLRYIHSDFGPAGLYIFPYLLGLFTSFYWYRLFDKKKATDLIMLSFLYVIIMFSYVTIISRSASWFLSLFVLMITVPLMEGFLRRRKDSSTNILKSKEM